VGCPDPPPILTRHVDPYMQKLRSPVPSGAAILEVGVNLEGEVVSACVVRSLRSDLDSAAQAAVLQWRWKVGALKGKERGFAMLVSLCAPDKRCK